MIIKPNTILFLFFVLFIWLIPKTSHSQDTLFTGTEKLIVKVIEIGPTTIKFKKENNPDGPTYEENKSKFKKIIFQNNLIETFENNNTFIMPQQNYTSETHKKLDYESGKQDANSHYSNFKKGAATGTWALFCGPLYGAIPAAIIAGKEPNQATLEIKTRHKSFEYKLGYQDGVRKINRKTAWYGYGIGSAANLVIIGTIFLIILPNI